jgi:hypothetical protein
MLRRALLLACLLALVTPATASAGLFGVEGSEIIYTPEGGSGVDQITGFQTATSLRFTRFGSTGLGANEGCVLVNDTVDCPKDGITRIVLDLGGGNDVATVSPTITIPVSFDGGSGNDGLFGGGGVDSFEGGSGNDNIFARDGKAESVDCGSGDDVAISDDGDRRISCEQNEGDADGDGARVPADCNDANPGIRPGVVDVLENGVDEDCSGADAPNLDRDGDGVPRPQDCNDTLATIKPGLREIPGNAVDENCDTQIEPLRPLSGTVTGAWVPAGARTRNVSLVAKGFPARTVIRVRCTGTGCPKKSFVRRVKTRKRNVNLHGALGNRSFRGGVRIELRFTRSQRVGRVLRYLMRTSAAPDVEFLCVQPGKSAGDC